MIGIEQPAVAPRRRPQPRQALGKTAASSGGLAVYRLRCPVRADEPAERQLPQRQQPDQRGAPGVDQCHHRGGHDLRHPDRRHRSLGGAGDGAGWLGRRRADAGGGADPAGDGGGAGGRRAVRPWPTVPASPTCAPPIIVTLASMGIARGLALLYTGGYPISGLPDVFLRPRHAAGHPGADPDHARRVRAGLADAQPAAVRPLRLRDGWQRRGGAPERHPACRATRCWST